MFYEPLPLIFDGRDTIYHLNLIGFRYAKV